jgi:competence protein ComEA
MSSTDRVYLFITLFLFIAAIAGGVMLAVQRNGNQPVEIVLSQTESPELSGKVYISGAVASPGMYPWQEGDTLEAILLDAGVEPDADFSHIKLYIPREGEEQSPQKIDINRADSRLLDLLPGIGNVTAQAIVDYRTEHGPFRTIQDLLNVKGIGPATLEKIRDYITVSD